ncbi:MAG: dockerin type I repeat-containing protein [Steroidobacteraceae bacterium]
MSSAPVKVVVERADSPTALTIDSPLIIFAYIGQTLPWTIFASFAGGLQTDVTRSTHLIIDSDNPRVAIVEHGMVKAVGSGRTSLNVRYGSIAQSISVTVPPFVRGDLNGDGRVDQSDLNVLLDALHSRANSPNDARDLNHDGVIDERDAEILKTLCTHPGCASH